MTEREADVLRLVAQGLGNREIAERMFLSPRTVEKHVASLLAKTGLRRAQLSWVFRPPRWVAAAAAGWVRVPMCGERPGATMRA